MDIRTKDGKYVIDVSYENWFSLYSTIVGRIEEKDEVCEAINFLKEMKCHWSQGKTIARQVNLIRDKLSQVKPDDAIYSIDDLKKKAPWAGKLSPVITSCANMYTTNDGKDLLYEIVSILCYSEYTKNDVIV